MTRGRAISLATLGAVAALVLLLGTATLGLRLRAAGDPDALPDAAPLDYGAAPFGAFSPLSSSFITDVLGGIIELPVRTNDAERAVLEAPDTSQATSLKRVEVAHALTNDDRSRAKEIPSVPFTARTDTRRATREPGEASACGAVRGGTVWYRYTSPDNAGLIANTFGSSYATTVSVFAATGETTSVGCDTDVQGNAIVQFAARKDVTYLFQITGPAGGGNLVFSLDPEGVTTVASLSTSGKPANRAASSPSISADGRFVAFESTATNLVPGAGNGSTVQIYLRDRVKQTLSLVSASPDGQPGSSDSLSPFVSGDGRYVAFESYATNLVADDTNELLDAFVRDVVAGTTERVSVSSEGAQLQQEPATQWGEATADRIVYSDPSGNDNELFPTLTPNGRYVAFQTKASNLVRGDHNHMPDVFVHDRLTRITERVSVNSSGRERGQETSFYRTPNEDGMIPSISGNGRVVMFRTSAANLASDDTNESNDIFVHDRRTSLTERISGAGDPFNVADDDKPNYALNEIRARSALSFDGRYVTFTASARPTQGPTPANIFVYDRRTGHAIRANLSSAGEPEDPNSSTRGPSISADGRFVAFHSNASNLVPGDENGTFDVFVRDMMTSTTVRLTNFTGQGALTEGCQPPRAPGCGSSLPAISAAGNVVAFEAALTGLPSVSVGAPSQVYVNERPLPA